MIFDYLSPSDKQLLYRQLTTNHQVHITAWILDLNYRPVVDVSSYFLDGQVSIDLYADVSRSLDLTLFDPGYRLGLDMSNPLAGVVFLNKMIQVSYTAIPPGWVPWSSQRIFTERIFTGPITDVSRDDAVISVKAMGKESMALEPWEDFSGTQYTRGQEKVRLIQSIMWELAGEVNIVVEPGIARTSKTTSNIALSGETNPWGLCQSLASSMGLDLFYDGNGILQLRKRLYTPQWELRDAADGMILTQPKIEYDLDNIVNRVAVTGATPTGYKGPLNARVSAVDSNPFSARNLGRSGRPRHMTEYIEDTALTTQAAVNYRALQRLTVGLTEVVDISFDMLPMPFLEEGDPVMVRTPDFSMVTNVQKMTIPLTSDKEANFGYHRNVSRAGKYNYKSIHYGLKPKPKPKPKPAKKKKGRTRR